MWDAESLRSIVANPYRYSGVVISMSLKGASHQFTHVTREYDGHLCRPISGPKLDF
jgi:hypothetical protein